MIALIVVIVCEKQEWEMFHKSLKVCAILLR